MTPVEIEELIKRHELAIVNNCVMDKKVGDLNPSYRETLNFHRQTVIALRFLLKEREDLVQATAAKDLAQCDQLHAAEWQTIDTVPQNRVVFVSLISPGGKRVTVKAKFIPAKTEEASFENDHAEYDEAADAYYCPEGWYEDVYADTGLDYGYIQFDGKPTHWMPLPSPPQREGDRPASPNDGGSRHE